MRSGKWMLAFTAASLLLAQEPAPPSAAGSGDPTIGPHSPQWEALSVKEKLRYDAHHFFDAENIVFAGMGAGLDQLRERPEEWEEGWGSFAQRYASHLGQYAIQRSIMFSVQAVNGEDARYFRSSRTSIKGRLADAFLHTVWRHDDQGGMMPAFSEFLGDYGAAAISRSWWPERFHNGRAIFLAGSDTILIDCGVNVFREFAPDVKRRLHLK